MKKRLLPYRSSLILFVILWLLAACGLKGTISIPTAVPNVTNSPFPATSPTWTATPLPPTPTPIPPAATVNGEVIPLNDYQGDLSRYQAAQGQQNDGGGTDASQVVLDDLIAQVLLSQGAREGGFVLDDHILQSRLDELESQAGGEDAFSKWLSENSYTMESFKRSLRRSIEAAWMRDQILAAMPDSAEQVHARQILVFNRDQADQLYAQLEAGTDFATLAATIDPATLGDLGWFPRGYLTMPKVEQAAFELQPGEYSQVIETEIGYHIVQVIERDPNRPLDPDARLVLESRALENWLEKRKAESEITILLPNQPN